jgi:hypothetical protein
MKSDLCPIARHLELADYDEERLRLFADVLGVELYRNWDGQPATTLEDAWRIREHFDGEHTRQAEADNARREQLAEQSEADLAPVRQRLEHQERRRHLLAALEADGPVDERFAAWDAEASERGAARFITPAPAAVPFRPGQALEELKQRAAHR